tara:strand:+ start:6571 stop:9132 length:2562 start_codon:yes stop_codon:yes gene_type:complete
MANWKLITMEWWLLTFFFSAILSLFIPIVPEFSLLSVILLLASFFILLKKYRLIAIAIFAFTWILIAASQYHNTLNENSIPLKQLHKQVYLIQGKVINIANVTLDNSRFNFLVTHWQGLKVSKNFKVRLSWKAPKQALLQGQVWQLAVKLKPAHGLANVGGFNYQLWLLQQQIIATGYVKADTSAKTLLKREKRNILLQETITWRQSLYRKLALMLADKPMRSLILALGFGERGELTPEHWQVLSATATQHLIAISGLHIGIVAFGSLIFIRVIVRLLPLKLILSTSWQLRLMQANLRYLPVLCSCFMAWYYAYLAGFSIPTLRALVMLLLLWSLKLMMIHVTLLRWLLLAILAILLFWPLSLLSVSFWLSISALVIIFSTLSRFNIVMTKSAKMTKPQSELMLKFKDEKWLIKYFYSFKIKASHWLKTLLLVQLSLTLAMLPIAAWLNYQLPLAAFFANILAVPLMSITVIPLTLLAVISLPLNTWLAGIFADLAQLSMSFVWQWLSYLASNKWAVIAVSAQQVQVLLVFFVFIFLVLFFRLSKRKIMATLCLFIISLAMMHFNRQALNEWQLSVLDVGHGLAIVIEKNQHVFLYDTGASYPSGFNMAEAAVLPYLKHYGYKAIDSVMISHNDNDHAGSLEQLKANIAINNIIANEQSLMPDTHCISGQRFTWQGLVFEVLSPAEVKGDKNDDSCVITISDGIHRVLLPGDISIKQEKRLLNITGMGNKLSSDLLIAPHHGSKSSASRHFLAAVSPRYAVFSTGYLNRWQMPSTEILKRYHDFNITTFNTAELGMVSFKFSQSMTRAITDRRNEANSELAMEEELTVTANQLKGNIEVRSYRTDIRPFWFVN